LIDSSKCGAPVKGFPTLPYTLILPRQPSRESGGREAQHKHTDFSALPSLLRCLKHCTYMDGARWENPVTFIAQTNFRNSRRRFGIKRADRRAHIYVVGKTGTGKSSLLGTLIRQDIEAGA
jgi:Cdc6-like AAA superfamily ATPase